MNKRDMKYTVRNRKTGQHAGALVLVELQPFREQAGIGEMLHSSEEVHAIHCRTAGSGDAWKISWGKFPSSDLGENVKR